MTLFCCDRIATNQAAFINYEGPKYTFVQTVAQPHPYVLPGFQNAISYTMPFVSEHCKPSLELAAYLFSQA